MLVRKVTYGANGVDWCWDKYTQTDERWLRPRRRRRDARGPDSGPVPAAATLLAVRRASVLAPALQMPTAYITARTTLSEVGLGPPDRNQQYELVLVTISRQPAKLGNLSISNQSATNYQSNISEDSKLSWFICYKYSPL